MPGILGIISSQPVARRRTASEAMLRTMVHEPSYASGSLDLEPFNLSAGWVAHGGSFSDCLPVWNESRDICLLFSGEHFTEPEEPQSLRAAGHACSTDRADYLVHLYEERGPQFFTALNGTFCGLLADLRQQKLVLFNDRYGLARLYYHQSADGFYFASEAKALLRVLPELRAIDLRGLGEFFTCGCTLQNRTLFRGVSLLPAGSAWTWTPATGPTQSSYFSPSSWEGCPALTPADYYESLKSTFARILPRYLRASQPVAMSLTGGLDSRMIMAWLPHGIPDLPCLTHGGIYRECADVTIARRVAQVCHQPHHVLRVDQNFFPQFPDLAMKSVYYTDGTMDVSGAVGLFVNRLARAIAPIRVTGNYGDEILRAIPAFSPRAVFEPMLSPELLPSIREAGHTFAQEARCRPLTFMAFKQVPWHHYARFALEQSQLPIRTPYLDNDLVSVIYQSPPELASSKLLAKRLIADGNPELITFPTDRGPMGRPGWLGKLRQACQEFTFKAEYACDYGMPQWLTRVDHALAPLHLERLFLGRHKYYHFRTWYRHQLSHFIQQLLLDQGALNRSYLNRRAVETLVTAHVEGRGNYTRELHQLLTIEVTCRRLLAST
jgi:asparagine synthase (glutamine-hydrolysing)